MPPKTVRLKPSSPQTSPRVLNAAPLSPGRVYCGDAIHLIPRLKNRSVALALFSPPYPDRNKLYPAPTEKEFPVWMVALMSALRPKLSNDGSVLIVIRSHIQSGVMSDFLLKTRLAIRESDWKECGELIWYKPDAGFLGSIQRPRRTWEQILWFSKTNKPYINLTANGNYTDRIGFKTTTLRFCESGWPIAGRSSKLRSGKARGSDVFTAHVVDNENGLMHPAAFPVTLCEKLILQFSKEGDLIVDPFCGSGSCLKAAANTQRTWIGIEVKKEYSELAANRLNAPVSTHVTAITPGRPVRLKTDFPETAKARRVYFKLQGLNASDAAVFEHILSMTVLSNETRSSAAISVNEISKAIHFNWRTVIRSLNRLGAAGLIERTQDIEWFKGRSSVIAVPHNLLVPLDVVPTVTPSARTGHSDRRYESNVQPSAG